MLEAIFDRYSPTQVDAWLARIGIVDPSRGRTNLDKLAAAVGADDLFLGLLSQVESTLQLTSDPDMALNNLERFFSTARSPMALAALFAREPTGIPILLRIFSTSQYLSDLLIRDPESYDFLRMTEGQPHTRVVLVDDLSSELRNVSDLAHAMTVIRRFKHRETLRIAFGDIIAEQRLALVAEQISFVADAICQGAWEFCHRVLAKKWGEPLAEDGRRIPITVLAMGKLGGVELNYSSDVDLIMVFEQHGECDGPRSRSALEYFEDLTRMFRKLLEEVTPLGFAYRVDLRLRPEGKNGRLCNPLDGLLHYYEMHGRPWERQALIKARPVAGDLEFGERVLSRLEPWIYARYLNRFEIGEVKSLKRQIEHRALAEGVDRRDVKTGHGGIRDIEFAIQFLQLLHGGAVPEVRTNNTLRAIERLQRTGCLTLSEESRLSQNYMWLRKLEHRLQIMFDLQIHTLPDNEVELKKTALRMGYTDTRDETALDKFRNDLAEKTEVNRKVLNHLLHGAFSDDADGTVPLEVDLLFAVEPNEETIREALAPFGFKNPTAALNQLQAMSKETTPFLPSQRCKHFLAAIVTRLLKEISLTPNPDETIVSLRSVADTLGAKGVLWELFHFQQNELELFVRLCAGAEYLTGILRNNPGMIDELADSLVMEHLPEHDWLAEHLSELLGKSQELTPIIHSFKQAQELRVGIRDLLGKTDVVEVTRALSAIADVCLCRVGEQTFQSLRQQNGAPMLDNNQGECGVAILACGKLGGHELNYQSDLDLIFVYQADGQTVNHDPSRQTSNQHFFSMWAAEITKFVSTAGPFGRLYEIDSRLRPTGKSGSLAVSVDSLLRYFEGGQGQSWERLAMCKARVVYATDGMAQLLDDTIRRAINAGGWSPTIATEIEQMRMRMQESCSKHNLKRGEGGTVDVEFLVQLLQMRYLATDKSILTPSTLDGLQNLAERGWLEQTDAEKLSQSYRLLRTVESRIRLSSESPASKLSQNPSQINKINFLLRSPDSSQLLHSITSARSINRQLFTKYIALLQSPVGG